MAFDPFKLTDHDPDEDMIDDEDSPKLFRDRVTSTPPVPSNDISSMNPQIKASDDIIESGRPSLSSVKSPIQNEGNAGEQLQTQKKPSLFQKLFGGGEESEQDELGLTKPQVHKQGIMSKILSVAMPTLFGLTSGVGVLPGLMSGLGGIGGRQREDDLMGQEQYQRERAARIKSMAPPPKSSDQKTFEWFQGLDSDNQNKFMDYKSSSNPFAAANFNYRSERDKVEDERKRAAEDRQARMDASKAAKENLGERMPADKAIMLAEGGDLPRSIDDLMGTIENNKDVLGPIQGKLRMLNPYDSKAQAVNSQIKRVKQVVGKFMEGGVLRKEDEEKYNEILAGIGNDPKAALAKLTGLKGDLQIRYDNYLDSLSNAGYNTSKFSRMKKKSILKNEPQPSAGNLTPKQQQGITWAKENPEDPRAMAILEKYGAR